MRLDSAIVAYPSWMGGKLPPCRLRGNAKGGRPAVRSDAELTTVARRRVSLGLTQAQVADHLGVCRESVSRVERRAPYTSRRDVRVLRLRARLNEFYLAVERGKVTL